MKILTLWQPWASLMAIEAKKVETRSWSTKYRGPMVIHAAAATPNFLGRSRWDADFMREATRVFKWHGFAYDTQVRALPKGAALCIVNLVHVEATSAAIYEDLSKQERVFGNYELGRYAWFTELVEVFEKPIPAKGNRMLWNWERP